MNKLLPLLAIFLLLSSVALADTLEDERAKGQQLAEDLLGPYLWLIFQNNIIYLNSPDQIIQFFASFVLVFFFISQLYNADRLYTGIMTLVVLIVLQKIFIINWVAFLVDIAPAILVFMLVRDLTAFTLSVSERTALYLGLFGFAITFWFHPTRTVFENTFGEIYSWTVGPVFFVIIIFIVIARMFSTVAKATQTVAASDARRQFSSSLEKYNKEAFRALTTQKESMRRGR